MQEVLPIALIEQFVYQGYIRIDHAFTKEVAEKAVEILWKDLPVKKFNPASWIEPVIRLGMYNDAPFLESINSPRLYAIFDQLVGKGNWIPCQSMGTFPVRFPSAQQPDDTGKHVDASFSGKEPDDYFTWRVNIHSRGRALLMLILYSEVSEKDAPTVLYDGSHLDVARLLKNQGEEGLMFTDLAA